MVYVTVIPINMQRNFVLDWCVEVTKVFPLETCLVHSVDKRCSSTTLQQVALLYLYRIEFLLRARQAMNESNTRGRIRTLIDRFREILVMNTKTKYVYLRIFNYEFFVDLRRKIPCLIT